MRVLAGGPLVAAAVVALAPAAAGAAVQPLARTDSEIGRGITDVSVAGDAVVWGELSPYRLGAMGTWTVRLGRHQWAQTRFVAHAGEGLWLGGAAGRGVGDPPGGHGVASTSGDGSASFRRRGRSRGR